MEKIHNSWTPLFSQYGINLDNLYDGNEIIYPPKELLFRVFEMNVTDIKVVLLGQDPYHSRGQAHGLSFSVPKNVKIPPSLKNIFKELKLEFPERNYTFTHGNLESWFYREKIFLLNSSLSVVDGKPGTHIRLWDEFTNDVIEYIHENNKNCVFLLLGNYAKSKAVYIKNKNNIVEAPHPSPLARGFIGSNVFNLVESKLKSEINWCNNT